MSFDVPADAYLRFMGRWSEPLAGVFLESADVRVTGQVLDVGCGPGVLTAVLVDRYGAPAVAAVDPSPSFVAATLERFPGMDVRQGVAEALPYADDTFDAALAQLVVHFMSDPVAGFREMGRVTSPGGVVAACVWDHAGGGSPLSLFWSAAQDIDPAAPNEAELPGTQEGQLASYAKEAGLHDIASSALTISLRFESYDEWWAPYLLGVGPLGAYVATLEADHLLALKERCLELLPTAPFEQPAVAWNVRALAVTA
jgi:SAM-dependent methyltransferase